MILFLSTEILAESYSQNEELYLLTIAVIPYNSKPSQTVDAVADSSVGPDEMPACQNRAIIFP
jgi:hypothetical protein